MAPESIAFLNANRHQYDLWVKAQFIRHLDHGTRQGLLDVIQREFSPGYPANLWCSQCVIDMLIYAYVQYDKWLEANGERIVNLTFPKHDGN